MLLQRTAATILVGFTTGSAAMAPWGTGIARAQMPDLMVSMKANPNPVPIGMGYEVQITVRNAIPPRRIIRPGPASPTAPPSAQPPLRPGRSTEQGANVEWASLLITTTVPSLQRVALQTNPRITIYCYALGIGSSAERCFISPVPRGGTWTITMVYPSPVPPGQNYPYTIGYGAIIDDVNMVAEQNETNNAAQVTVSFTP
jgi:hypothetical protein